MQQGIQTQITKQKLMTAITPQKWAKEKKKHHGNGQDCVLIYIGTAKIDFTNHC